jgi:hypothetical protein
MDNLKVPFICILVVMLITLVLFKNQNVRNINIGLYCLFIIYGYLNINKKYALVGFVGLLVTYALVRAKSTDVLENMTNMNSENKKNEFKLPKRTSIEPTDEGAEGVDENDDDDADADADADAQEDADADADDEEDEKGIEQFGLADKFSQLHGMIHKMQNAAAKQQEQQQQEQKQEQKQKQTK